MTTKHQLTATQWDVLTHAPLAMWLGVSGVDSLVASLEKEYLAFDLAAKALAVRFGSNELVLAVIAELHRPSEAQRKGMATVDVTEVIAVLRRTAEALGALPDAEERTGFKKFLLAFGERIARASSESVVDSRLTISQAEDEFLGNARTALGL